MKGSKDEQGELQPTTFRFRPADRQRLDRLRRKFGLDTNIGTLRKAMKMAEDVLAGK